MKCCKRFLWDCFVHLMGLECRFSGGHLMGNTVNLLVWMDFNKNKKKKIIIKNFG